MIRQHDAIVSNKMANELHSLLDCLLNAGSGKYPLFSIVNFYCGRFNTPGHGNSHIPFAGYFFIICF